MTETLPAWAEIQKKTFTKWVNFHLKSKGIQIEDLAVDFSDGANLISLLEQLSSSRLISSKNRKKPRFRSQKLENVGVALTFLKNEGLRLVGIGAEDVVDCHVKLILGLIWTIILRWQIQPFSRTPSSSISIKHELLRWVNTLIREIPARNLSKDWQDGKLLAALVNLISPGSVTLCDNTLDLVTQAVRAAEIQMIPALIDPEDIISPNLDELSMMTYVALFRDRYNLKLEQDEQDDIHYHSPNTSGQFLDIMKLTLRESVDTLDSDGVSSAKQFNLPIKWTTNMKIFIKEFHVCKPVHKLHDIRCKVNADDQVRRTSVASKPDPESNAFVWNQELKFDGVDPRIIKILLYCSNKILPNEKLGRVEIPRDQFSKGRTISKQVAIESHGELSISITQSKTFVAPFKFTISRHRGSLLVKDVTDNVKFRLCDGDEYQYELYDRTETCLFNIAVRTFPKPTIDIYRFGAPKPIVSISVANSKCYILGISGIEWIDISGSELKYVRMADDEKNICLGTVSFTSGNVFMEISPDKGFILILVCLLAMLDGKTL